MSDNYVNIGVSELYLQTDSNNEFARQGSDQANGCSLSENQEFEKVSQVGDSIAESSRVNFAPI